MTSLLETIGRFVAFATDILRQTPAAMLRPRLILVQLARFVAGSVGLVVVIGISIGLVAWLHFGRELARFEAESLLPAALMLAVVLELGPLAVGLIAAGRLASGVAAELAAMKTTEQIDALRCLGVSPVRWLLAPRVLACILLLPPLTVLVDYAALLGGFLAEWLAGELSFTAYYQASLERLRIVPALLATAKAVVFGLLVGLIACWYGTVARPGTEAVGIAATRAVVTAALAVILSNVLLVRIIQLLT